MNSIAPAAAALLLAVGGVSLAAQSPAAPQSPVENLSFLAQDALELTRGTASSLSLALRVAGFGETTRGAMALDDGDKDAGPAPAILQLEVRTVPAN